MAVIQDLSLILKAKLFRGFADPSRLAILEALRSGEKGVSELASIAGLTQPNASAHLSCLRECGLVQSRQEGRFVYYSLADARIEDVLQGAEGILASVAEAIYDCTHYGGKEDG